MKTRIFFKVNTFHQTLVLLALVLGLSNNTSVFAQDKVAQQNRTTIVFVDKTLSVEPNSFIQEKNHSWLKRIIKENSLITGDKIIISFIFKNTSSITNKFEFIYHPPKQRTARMSSSEARIAKIKFAKRLRAYKKGFAEKILTKAFSFKPSLSGTDVVGSIKLLSDIASINSNNILKVLYLSDMHECSSFSTLYCIDSKNNFTSITQALTQAKKDYPKLLKTYQLTNTCLNKFTEITIIFPATELDTDKSFAILPEYWSYIFTQCGVTQINYH